MDIMLTAADNMDSREIARLTEKRHDNVMRDIEDQLGQLEGGALRFESSYFSEQNKQLKCYILPKRECLILASGYSVKLRASIIDRWAELEAAKPVVTILDYAKALVAASEAIVSASETNDRLLIELDQSKEYATIKRMEKLFKRKFAWVKLKAQGSEMGVASKEVFDQNYGTVKAYRADVWMETYQVIVPKGEL